MAKEEAIHYKVVITSSGEVHFYELAEYLYQNMSLLRAEKVTKEIIEMVLGLDLLHSRGSKEEQLSGRINVYRYLLFKRTTKATVKIIYYIDETERTVYVTDFFPTEKDPRKIALRNR